MTSTFNLNGDSESRPSAVVNTLSEYVQKSTIHGVALVGDDERNKFERIWWFIMLACSVFGACYLIYQAYRTMKENPIIESPSLTRPPMWEVPFPAITFCPEPIYELSSYALDKANWPDFVHSLLPDNLTALEINEIFYSSLIFATLLLRRSGQDNYDILAKVLPEVEIEQSFFGTLPTHREVSLQKTITSIGACVTFNMYQEKHLLRDGVILSSLVDARDKTEQLWSRDFGFNDDLPIANYTNPFRSFILEEGLYMLFSVNDTQRFSVFSSEIFVSFHAPDELPLFTRHSEEISIKPGKNTIVQLTPLFVVPEGIEHYEPEERQCYYSNERYLKFYKTYTQNNCETECLANYTLTKCGCLPYYLPHFNDTKLCTSEFRCLLRKKEEIFLPVVKNARRRRYAPIDDCNCLPSCTQLTYKTVQISTGVDSNDDNGTSVYIYNKYPNIKKHIRSELHSISEFFSSCGGSLGLFLGMSIFSIAELLYFCTVRLYLHSTKRTADSN